MRILFDQGTPAPLRRHLAPHAVETAYELGWATLANGDLLDAAEQNGFDVLISTDHSLRFQQSLAGRRLAVLVLLSTSWPRIQRRVNDIQDALSLVQPGDVVEIAI